MLPPNHDQPLEGGARSHYKAKEPALSTYVSGHVADMIVMIINTRYYFEAWTNHFL